MADDGGTYAFSGLPAGGYTLDFTDSVTLPSQSGWQQSDGGPFTLNFADSISHVAVANGQTSDETRLVLYSGTRLLSEEIELSSNYWPTAVSPDGAWVAVFSAINSTTGLGTLTLVSTSDAVPPRVLSTTAFANAFWVQPTMFSPDSSELLYLTDFVSSSTVDGSSMYIVSTALGEPPVLVDSDVSYFRLSPDGLTIAYDKFPSGFLGVVSWAVPQAPIQLAADVNQPYEIRFTPDSDEIGYLGYQANNSFIGGQLEFVDISGAGPPVVIAPNVNPFQPTANHRVVYGSAPTPTSSQLILMMSDISGSGAAITLAANFDVDFTGILPSPDWRRAATVDKSGSLYIVDSQSDDAPQPVASDLSQVYNWAPDGSRICFQGIPSAAPAGTSSDLEFVNPDGGGFVSLGAGGQVTLFSPDSQWLAITAPGSIDAGGNQIRIVNAAGTVVLGPFGSNVTDPQRCFSPDSSRLAFLQGNTSTLSVVSITPGSLPIAVGTSRSEAYSFSPDSRSIGFINPDGGATIAGADGIGLPLPLIDRSNTFIWIDSGTVLATHEASTAPGPFDFQDGLYRFAVPQPAP